MDMVSSEKGAIINWKMTGKFFCKPMGRHNNMDKYNFMNVRLLNKEMK